MYILTKIKSFLLFVVVIFALTSCVTSRKVNYLQDGKHIAQYADSVEYVDYTVKAGDLLYVYLNSLDKESQNLFNGGISHSTYANNPLYSYNIYEDGTIEGITEEYQIKSSSQIIKTINKIEPKTYNIISKNSILILLIIH